MRLVGILSLLPLLACRATPAALQVEVDVVHYDLTLQLDEDGAFNGRLDLLVRHPDTLDALTLSAGDLDLEAVRVAGQSVDFERIGVNLRIPLEPSGQSQIEIEYRGRPGEGLYFERHDGQQVLFTDSWPDRGRGWLPAVHHPADPSTFALTLILPAGAEAIASGTFQGVDTLETGVQYRFALETPAPTYAFAFAVADFAVTPAARGGFIRHVMLASDSSLVTPLRRIPEALAFFEDRIGPYAYGSFSSVQIPIAYGGMENAAAPFLNADMLHQGNGEMTAIHELAHQWFGNRVVIADWQELWLSEGFARYLPTLFIEYADGIEAVRPLWVDLAAFTTERRRSHRPLVLSNRPDPNDHLSWVVYEKGASVLHLLRLKLGDDVFFRTIQTLYRDFAGKPLSSLDVRDVFERESGMDLEDFFAYWVYGRSVPRLLATWDVESRTIRWRIEDDGETLLGVPFELQIMQGDQVSYVNVLDGHTVLPGRTPPSVLPVGVMLQVDGNGG